MRLARLKQRKEFLAAAEHGRRFRSSALTVQVRDRQEHDEGRDGGLRLGLTASRKTGNAVKRNRIRRRLRAAAEQAFGAQAARSCDVVLVARPETLTAGFGPLVADLSVALDKARPSKPGSGPRGRSQTRPPRIETPESARKRDRPSS